jgi:hypothetical protein
MTLADIIHQLELTPLTNAQDYNELTPSAGYTSDLLSCVMASATHQGIWVTLQAHSNIVAVSALLDLCAVIITEGAVPDMATIQKANEEGVILLSTAKSSFYVVGKLWELGLRAE